MHPFCQVDTLENYHFEPQNHPIEKENNLNQTSIIMFHVNLLPGVSSKDQWINDPTTNPAVSYPQPHPSTCDQAEVATGYKPPDRLTVAT